MKKAVQDHIVNNSWIASILKEIEKNLSKKALLF